VRHKEPVVDHHEALGELLLVIEPHLVQPPLLLVERKLLHTALGLAHAAVVLEQGGARGGDAAHPLLLALSYRLHQLLLRRRAHRRVLLLHALLLLCDLPVAPVGGLDGGAVEAGASLAVALRLAVQRARALLDDMPVRILLPLLLRGAAVVFL